MNDPVFLKIELPSEASDDDLDALRGFLETELTKGEGLSAEVDVDDPSRGIGGVDPTLIVSWIATGAGVAANLGVILKTIKEAKSLFSSEKSEKKAELTPVQKLLLSLDPEKMIFRIDGVDIPVMEMVADTKP